MKGAALRAQLLDRRDFKKMHGVLTQHGWAHTENKSHYKHTTVPGTILLHTHTYGGAAWNHAGHDSNRGVRSLVNHLEKIHDMQEMTASAAIGTSSSTGDPDLDNEKDVVKPADLVGNDDRDDAGGVPESLEDIHVRLQRHYFSHVGTHRRKNETFSHYVRIHPKDGSVEQINIKYGNGEHWEHRHHGVIKKGSDADSLSQILAR